MKAGEHLRYIHRRDAGEDIYFITNPNDRSEEATCRCRVSGSQPEWWDPLTGTTRELLDFSDDGHVTSIPLCLEAHGSGFLCFRLTASRKGGVPQNFPELRSEVNIKGPWKVTFDPRWGGPGEVQFAELEDWTRRKEPGIRHYSGKVTYEANFDLPHRRADGECLLSLGTVRHMASIRLNGQDLGIVWCEPWRVAIPSGCLNDRNNILKVVVANLWINRLIGDSGLPEGDRITWTTSNPFHPDSPLEPSGLLGPVTILRQLRS